MATACERLDDLVKDYLLFRGFTATAKALDHEVKHDKDKGLRADKIVEQLMAYVGSYDLQHLREYWAHLNQRFFSRLEQRYAVSVRKLEVSLLKLYVVNAQQSNRQDRVRDFFEKIGPELQNQLEFRDWFVFQFLPNPAENGNFALYFTRQWQETVQLSLHNFLQVILQAMPVPTLLNFDHDSRRMAVLQDENDSLRNQLNFGVAPDKKLYRVKPSEQSSVPQPLPDLIYDFSGLADPSQEGRTETVTERQKTSRRFPINLSTPLLKRNKQPDTRQDSAGGNQQQSSHGNQSSNNSGTESHPYPTPQAQAQSGTGTYSASAPGQGVALTTASGVVASSFTASSAAVGGPKTNTARVVSDPQSSATMAAGQPPGSAETTMTSGTRKKAPRELTSFPPYTSPQSEKSNPLPAKASGLVTSERPPQQGQGERSVGRPESGGGEETGSREVQSAVNAVDYGPAEPLQQWPEGKQCPFLVLSDDEYLEHRSAVCYSRFSLSGQRVASLDADGIVKVWTWSPQPSTTATVMSRAPFLSLDWASKSDRWLLLGNQSGQIRLFDTREIKTFREASVESPYQRVTYLSTCPSTMTFASCLSSTTTTTDPSTDTGKLALWDLKTMKMERYLPIEPVSVSMNCCVHNITGKLLLAGGVDGVIRLYDLSQRQCVRSWRAGQGAVQTLQFAHQEASFFTMGPQGRLFEWSLTQTSQPLRQIAINEGSVGAAPSHQSSQNGNSPANGQLFSLSKDKTYLLCSMQQKGVICKVGEGQSKDSMQRILDLSPHGDAVTTVDWSPCIDTPVCLTGARDGQLKVVTLLSQ